MEHAIDDEPLTGRVGPVWAGIWAPFPAALVPVLLNIGQPRLAMFPLFLAILWALELFPGVPIRWALLRQGDVRLIRYVLGGCVMAGLPAAGYFLWLLTSQSESLRAILGFQILFTLMGGMTGGFHWMLVRQRLIEAQARRRAAELDATFD